MIHADKDGVDVKVFDDYKEKKRFANHLQAVSFFYKMMNYKLKQSSTGQWSEP